MSSITTSCILYMCRGWGGGMGTSYSKECSVSTSTLTLHEAYGLVLVEHGGFDRTFCHSDVSGGNVGSTICFNNWLLERNFWIQIYYETFEP